MASATPATAIEARLRANWTTTPILIDNEDDQIPTGADGMPVPFIVLEFPGGAADQITIGAPGNNLFREMGAFMLHVLVPKGTGATTARAYADTLAAIFRGTSFSGVDCWAPFPPNESPRADGTLWGVSFGIPYKFDLAA